MFWEVLSLERDPLSLVRITDELLKNRVAVVIRCADHATFFTHKSSHELRRQALVARSVQIACGLEAKEFVCCCIVVDFIVITQLRYLR
jgi:hypothetical protein